MKNLAVDILVTTLKNVHESFSNTMNEVTDEVASFAPEGKANPIAGIYAHLVFGEDMFLHVFLKRDKPLSETKWKDKTGISSPHPTDWTTEYPKWLKEVKVDVEKAKAYQNAVFGATEEYVASLSDEDLEKTIDMNAFGMGEMRLGNFINELLIVHCASIMGEISILKGIQGFKGYPF